MDHGHAVAEALEEVVGQCRFATSGTACDPDDQNVLHESLLVARTGLTFKIISQKLPAVNKGERFCSGGTVRHIFRHYLYR